MASNGWKRDPWRRYPSKHRSGANAAKNSTATATTATAEGTLAAATYVGRFAPSPSGDLHLGSLYTAAASYLDARAHRGRWLVRLEDLDRPRVVPGSAAGILRTLLAFGFEWDGPIRQQSQAAETYMAVLDRLRVAGLTFPCTCSRSDLADADRYPGYCRKSPRAEDVEHARSAATRLRVESGYVAFTDRVQGMFRQNVASAVGDVVLRRRDGIIAYLLAVVVDDAAQRITHVVRGADLLDNTPRQIYLQRHLGLPTPVYAHVPVLTEPHGQKLAKSARGVRLASRPILGQLLDVFRLLGLRTTPELFDATLPEVWAWAVAQWRIESIPRCLSLPLAAEIA